MAHVKLYNAAGEEVQSVTTIIGNESGWNKQILLAWARRVAMDGLDPNKVKDDAADTGSLTHHLIECHINGETPDYGEYGFDSIAIASKGLESYVEWETRQSIKYLLNEVSVVSEEYQYGGTFDCVSEIDGVLSLIDFKTSKSVYTDHVIQMSAYRQAIKEAKGIDVKQCVLIKIPKDMLEESVVTPYYLDNGMVDASFEVFKCLLGTARYHKAIEKYVSGLNPKRAKKKDKEPKE